MASLERSEFALVDLPTSTISHPPPPMTTQDSANTAPSTRVLRVGFRAPPIFTFPIPRHGYRQRPRHPSPLHDTRTRAMEEGDLNQQSHASGGYGQDMPQRADIDEILRRKRKAREYKVRMRFSREEHAESAAEGNATGEGQASIQRDVRAKVTSDDS
jgi:hypothetical protein